MKIKLLFIAIFLFMLWVTSWATLQESVFEGGAHLLQYRWGWATLADAYCGFITFFVWLCYREPKNLVRAAWLVAILVLGNLAMSAYVLLKIYKRREGQTIADALFGKAAVANP